jgi:molybdopterin-containing oxidoreductase family iron-sulfur binding subunit
MATARRRLGGASGARFWRSLEELAGEPGFARELHGTLGRLPEPDSPERRRFLQLLGASLAFGGLAACSGPPAEQMVPWVSRPGDMPAGQPQFYATVLHEAGDVLGVLAESREGRPTKIEGNPAHPASLGGTGALPQAAVLDLWDPDRSQAPMRHGAASTWDAFAAAASDWRARFAIDGGGLVVVGGALVSPTLRAQREAFLRRFPGSRWHVYEAVGSTQAEQGARLAFGRPLLPRYRFDQADVIVALEADFLGGMPGRVAYARAFAGRRRPGDPHGMNRLYVLEGTPSLAGAMADHRWALRSSAIARVALELARALGVADLPASAPSGLPPAQLAALAADLAAHRGRSLVLAGESQPPEVHALAHLLNERLGNAGRTVDYVAPAVPAEPEALPGLAAAIRAGRVHTLVLLDSNLAYAAPAGLELDTLLRQVPQVVHWGLHRDETAHLAAWHLPASHALEAWSDAQSFDGTVAIAQPLLAPLYDTRSVHEFVAVLMGETVQDGHAIVQSYWRTQLGGDPEAWRERVRGGVAQPAPPAEPVTASAAFLSDWKPAVADTPLELLFRPDPTVWDGRHANNGWLQELPKPLTQLTWGNAALLDPQLAARMGLSNGDVVALDCAGRRVEAPVWIMPGQAAGCVTVHLGYGRRHAGHVGDGLGFDAYRLRGARAPWIAPGLALAKTGRRAALASTQDHFRIEDDAPVRELDAAALAAGTPLRQPPPPSFYPPQPQGEYAWGMTVDLNACIGCKGCSIACQAENNIPVVGADQVRRGREMHWMRVDRYYAGDPVRPRLYHQPVPCMHCEHAPCELVCPVGATVHDSEGLNVQVYNRCVGTRFCSNNCPYKVRRFNFLQYSDLTGETLKAQRNPEVSVRNRGVMEKCTYCIQRIERAHIAADRENRAIADGEVVTACQAACPTQAIRFGNLRDPGSAVSRARASSRNYDLLEELNTRPHTSYLARVRNPNPALGDEA